MKIGEQSDLLFHQFVIFLSQVHQFGVDQLVRQNLQSFLDFPFAQSHVGPSVKRGRQQKNLRRLSNEKFPDRQLVYKDSTSTVLKNEEILWQASKPSESRWRKSESILRLE